MPEPGDTRSIAPPSPAAPPRAAELRPPRCPLRAALCRAAVPARLPGDRHCQVQPRPRRRPQPLAHWLLEWLTPPLGEGPLQGRARGWGPKLGEASCGHPELLLCQPRNRQLQRKAREEASSSGRGPWLRGTGSLGWNIESIARGLGLGVFVDLL